MTAAQRIQAAGATTVLQHVERLDEPSVRDLVELYRGEWWTKDRSLKSVRAMLERSDLVFGVVDPSSGRLIGFARVLSDFVFKALVFDVIVAPSHRGRGIGDTLMRRILAHRRLRSVRHVELYCLPELEAFYRRCGFTPDVGGVRLMRRASVRRTVA